MHFDLLLQGGDLVGVSGIVRADIGIAGGRVEAVGDLHQASADEKINLSGLTVLPGVIDTQVHFREPGMEHKEDLESGTRSAVFGGVTAVLEMPNTNPPTTSQEALKDKLQRAHGRAWCDYGFFVGATAENAKDLGSLERLPGTPGIKIFMGSSTGSLLVGDDETLREVLKHGRGPCPIHAEDVFRLEERKSLIEGNDPAQHPFLRDSECARLATERIIRLCAETRRPVHILHISTADEIPLIREAKSKGLPVTAEVTPQHLWFASPDCYDTLGTLAQMNPPIRDHSHRAALRAALQEGVFDVIGSDHAPHTLEEKAEPYPRSPSGMPGVQTLLPAMLTLGLIDLPTFVKMTSRRPAELYSMQHKGRIAPGYDADFAIVDLGKRWIFERSVAQSKCGWSPFEGQEFKGNVVHTMVRGRFVVRDQQLTGTPTGTAIEYEA